MCVLSGFHGPLKAFPVMEMMVCAFQQLSHEQETALRVPAMHTVSLFLCFYQFYAQLKIQNRESKRSRVVSSISTAIVPSENLHVSTTYAQYLSVVFSCFQMGGPVLYADMAP